MNKVYLSRSQFGRAKESEVGLDLIDDFFFNNGYEIIYPEQISLAELINALYYANECASESGTAAHNFLFCNQKQLTYVIERQSQINTAQLSIDVIRHLESVYIDAALPLSSENEPCFLYYTEGMRRLVKLYGYIPPSEKYLSPERRKKYFENYLFFYKKIHRDTVCEKDIAVLRNEFGKTCGEIL